MADEIIDCDTPEEGYTIKLPRTVVEALLQAMLPGAKLSDRRPWVCECQEGLFVLLFADLHGDIVQALWALAKPPEYKSPIDAPSYAEVRDRVQRVMKRPAHGLA